MWKPLISAALVGAALSAAGGCGPAVDEVVVYTALDREFSEPILDDFESESGVSPLAVYDAESTKTVGLVARIIQEEARPSCDVFWNNEILHTLRLKKLGLLAPFDLPQAEKFPADYRSEDGLWYGFAARARVLIVNTDLVPEAERPRSIHDLTDPKWKDRCGLARPLAGTTATHAAVLFALWGDGRAKDFFLAVKANARVVSGNRQVADDVGRGRLAFGITDTDDAIVEIEKGRPVAIVYPDQGEAELGTLFIPNTLAIIKGGPNPRNARRLLEYLLTAAVERKLAEGASAQFPLHADAGRRPRVYQEGVKHMKVDFEEAAERWDAARAFLRQEF